MTTPRLRISPHFYGEGLCDTYLFGGFTRAPVSALCTAPLPALSMHDLGHCECQDEASEEEWAVLRDTNDEPNRDDGIDEQPLPHSPTHAGLSGTRTAGLIHGGELVRLVASAENHQV
jgi:hypothetical protein